MPLPISPVVLQPNCHTSSLALQCSIYKLSFFTIGNTEPLQGDSQGGITLCESQTAPHPKTGKLIYHK